MPPRSAPLPGPLPVTKNVMFGACGSGGGAAGCWACALDAASTDANAETTTNLTPLIGSPPSSFGLDRHQRNDFALQPKARNDGNNPGQGGVAVAPLRDEGHAWC